MRHRSFIIGLILVFASNTHGFICDRTLKKADKPQPNINKYIIEVTGNPESYSPEEIYTIVLKSNATTPVRSSFAEFMLVVEPENPSEAIQNVLSGDLTPVDYSIAKFTSTCPNAVIHTNTLAKHEVQIFWRAPPSGNGCVAIKATVFESSDIWYTDDGGLTKVLCEEESNIDVQPPPFEECSACNEAKYEVAFQGMWTRNTHPKDYPRNMWSTKLGEVVGASHKFSKSFWDYDSLASDGLKLLAEEGNTTLLEDELKEMVKNDDIRTIIKARELSYPNIIGTSYTVFRVDQKHHLISLVSKITPSPDWVVGVANFELCTEDGQWLESRTLNLYPWDVGTDDGKSYTDGNEPSIPPQPIRKLTATDEDTPFYNSNGEPVKPIAKLHIIRQKVYEKLCESVEQTEDDDTCKLSGWTEWSNCSTTCGNRVQTRNRELVHPENEAKCMEDDTIRLQETVAVEYCRKHDIDCEITPCVNATWLDWSPCSATCGTGFKIRNGNVLSEENLEDEDRKENKEETVCVEAVECYNNPCEGEITATESVQFTMSSEARVLAQGPDGPDVVDCVVSRWSEWSTCQARGPCQNGHQVKQRYIQIHPSNGGKPCPKKLQKRKHCKTPCDGGGTDDDGDDDDNNNEHSNNRVADCKMGPWSSWSPCSSNCGSSAVQQRTRNIERHPTRGGKPCGPRIEIKKCPLPYACNNRETFNLNRY